MRKGPGLTVFVYSLCVWFLMIMNGFPRILAEAKERELPIGEMVSKGVVKFEAREKVWKEVEPSHFPIFRGTKVKVEKGTAFITLADQTHIEVGSDSLCSFDPAGQFTLSQGKIQFRVPAESELNFKVGSLSILKSRILQASRSSSVPSRKDEETVGSIFVHSNGSVSVRSVQGKLSILDQDHVILAALSAKEQATLPSSGLRSAPKVMVAQVGESSGAASDPKSGEEFLGLGTWAWVGIAAGVAGAAGIGFAVYDNNKGDDHDRTPICR